MPHRAQGHPRRHRQYRAQIEKTEIRAPFDGVSACATSASAPISPRRSRGDAPENQPAQNRFHGSGKVRPGINTGDIIKFTIAGFARTFHGKGLCHRAACRRRLPLLKVRALVQNSDAGLLPGAFADIEIVSKRIRNALWFRANASSQLRNKQVIIVKSGNAESGR